MLRNVPQRGLRPLQIIYRHCQTNGKNKMGRDVWLLHQEHNENPEQKLELEYRNSLEEKQEGRGNVGIHKMINPCLCVCIHMYPVSSWDTVDFQVSVGFFGFFFSYFPCAKVLWDWWRDLPTLYDWKNKFKRVLQSLQRSLGLSKPSVVEMSKVPVLWSSSRKMWCRD